MWLQNLVSDIREERKMTVIKIRAMRRTCGRNRENKENYKIKSFTTCTPVLDIRMIKFGRMKLIGHVARMSGKRNAYKV